MFTIRKPGPEAVKAFLAQARESPLSYAEVGATATVPPAGFDVDHNRARLGSGREAFMAACAALRRWEMFHLGWVTVSNPETPIAAGEVVAVPMRVLGLWLLGACRIVYVIEETGRVERYGLAYGTLPMHPERGEERFSVEWDHADDSVWYDILGFSHPHHLLARLGYPLARRMQRRFVRDSIAAMQRAASERKASS